ncbi:MAG: DUF3857 domain-containing protein [Bacteroidia bacterium]|nr:DUF3857 domain-containing protein [Bacteroidia bacterium]
MKNIVIAFCFLGISLASIFSQTMIGRWGKVAKEDLEAVSYSYSPGAEAIVLFDQGQWFPQDLEKGTARLVHHYQIKILTEEGLGYANQLIGFQKDERVVALRAQVHWLENGKHKKELLKIGALPDSTLSADSLCKSFTFAAAKVGAVLEVRYSLITPSGDVLRPWYFQREIPTKHSSVALVAFDPLVFRTKTSPTEFVAASRNKWVRRYLPAMPEDPLIPNIQDLRLHIHFQLLPWEEISEKGEWEDLSYALEVGTVVAVDRNVLEALASLAGSLTQSAVTEEEKVANIFRHVQRHMKWNGIYSRAVTKDPGAVYRSRSGNSAEINMLLYLLLESAGLAPSRVFVSTRDHGKTLDEPFWGQFNHLIVQVDADGHAMFLDATEGLLDYFWLPMNAANGRGWALKDSVTKWVDVVPSPGSAIRHALTLKLDPEGMITGTVKESYLGYPEAAWNRDVDLSSFQLSPVNPLETDLRPKRESPVVMSYPARDFQVNRPSADTMIIPLDPYKWRSTLPSVYGDRSLPADLGYSFTESVQMNIEIPAGWVLAQGPTPVKIQLNEGAISMQIQANATGQLLEIGWIYQVNQPRVEAYECAELATFLEASKARLGYELVLVKK